MGAVCLVVLLYVKELVPAIGLDGPGIHTLFDQI